MTTATIDIAIGVTTSTHRSLAVGPMRRAASKDLALRHVYLGELGDGLELYKPIPVSIELCDGGFIASFVEANVNASGDSWLEAYSDLRYLIVDQFELLNSKPSSELGPGPRAQLKALQKYVKATANA